MSEEVSENTKRVVVRTTAVRDSDRPGPPITVFEGSEAEARQCAARIITSIGGTLPEGHEMARKAIYTMAEKVLTGSRSAMVNTRASLSVKILDV